MSVKRLLTRKTGARRVKKKRQGGIKWHDPTILNPEALDIGIIGITGRSVKVMRDTFLDLNKSAVAVGLKVDDQKTKMMELEKRRKDDPINFVLTTV